MVKAGVKLVAEGANMPSDGEAISHFHSNDVEFAPAKAANAGGVAVSGLEMAQNSARLSWTKEEVDAKLKVDFCMCQAKKKQLAGFADRLFKMVLVKMLR